VRQRAAFAIGQIVIANHPGTSTATIHTKNWQWKVRGAAFGNWRDVLRHATLDKLMGSWLNNAGNTGRTPLRNANFEPNQNYARELMQLFSLGVYRLNKDGTHARDAAGGGIQNYSEDDVKALARILSGWHSIAATPSAIGEASELTPNGQTHYRSTETLFGAVFPIMEGGAAIEPTAEYMRARVEQAIEALVMHPSCGPYICKQLIQKLVTDNPSPQYVRRVVAAWEDNGAGVRGDLPAVFRAIWIDPEARGAAKSSEFGRAQEWVLAISKALRLADVAPQEAAARFAVLWNRGGGSRTWPWYMGQQLFRYPSVFNTYPFEFPIDAAQYQAPAAAMWTTNGLLGGYDKLMDSHVTEDGATVFGPSSAYSHWQMTGITQGLGSNEALLDRLTEEFCQGRALQPIARDALLGYAETLTAKPLADRAVWLLNALALLPEAMEVV
jgi:uncharacterized protein (DUF1800 family)